MKTVENPISWHPEWKNRKIYSGNKDVNRRDVPNALLGKLSGEIEKNSFFQQSMYYLPTQKKLCYIMKFLFIHFKDDVDSSEILHTVICYAPDVVQGFLQYF